EGTSIPVIPGIMPITNYHQLRRFSDNCGAEIPRWLRLRLEAYADDPVSLQQLGQEFITRMCQDLLDHGVPGLHFYTLNKAEPTVSICQDLQWK
ncbi:MAG: methylenetetrahydrofolate reductase, partial [Gammaproteobacteria bacterium]